MNRQKLLDALAKPIRETDEYLSDEEFDPWGDVIEGIFGGYNSACDDLMIAALKAVRDRETFNLIATHGLAGELALYILAGHGLTNYGTSPRGGWPDEQIADLWQALIDKWEAHSKITWGETKK